MTIHSGFFSSPKTVREMLSIKRTVCRRRYTRFSIYVHRRRINVSIYTRTCWTFFFSPGYSPGTSRGFVPSVMDLKRPRGIDRVIPILNRTCSRQGLFGVRQIISLDVSRIWIYTMHALIIGTEKQRFRTVVALFVLRIRPPVPFTFFSHYYSYSSSCLGHVYFWILFGHNFFFFFYCVWKLFLHTLFSILPCHVTVPICLFYCVIARRQYESSPHYNINYYQFTFMYLCADWLFTFGAFQQWRLVNGLVNQ